MWRTIRSNRPIFLAICFSIVILIGAAVLLVQHSLNRPPTINRPPTVPQATCGAVVFWPGKPQPVNHGAQQVERCFSRAYQQCTAMTMEVDENAVDSGTTTVYWLHKQGNTCQIFVQSSSFVPGKSPTSSGTATCQSILTQKDGLLFQQCGNSGDVFIAA